MNTDPIADMLTRLRNADRAGHKEVRMPYSKMKYAMLKVMVSNHLIAEVNIEKSGKFDELNVVLKDRQYPLQLKRISKPGQRIYVSSSEIPSVMSGLGITIVFTPKGVMTGRDARKQNVGGELVCEIA
ncbi:MAG: 30S ribosomal protein S8 [Candidatus Peregrinibacteria bacterium]|nr:30S ribosomal protein S8 [Candidatus Peregrinibacteria bacterium]